MEKKYKRHGMVPFIEPVPEKDYSKVRRSPDPFETAKEMGILDTKKIDQFLRKVKK